MSIYVNNGSWRNITEFYVKHNDQWKTVVEAYVKDGGSWRQFWPTGVFYSYSIISVPVSGGYTSRNNGTTSGSASGIGFSITLLTATSAGYQFNNITANNSATVNGLVVTIQASGTTSISAVYIPILYYYDLYYAGPGEGTTTPASALNIGPYNYTNLIQLTATPSAGSVFGYWLASGVASPTAVEQLGSNPIIISFPPNNFSISAIFLLNGTVTAVYFAPPTDGTYYLTNCLSTTVTAYDGTGPVSYKWYNWVSNAWTPATASGPTASAYQLGCLFPPGTPDIVGSPPVSTYYYAVELSSSLGVSNKFEWKVNLDPGIVTTVGFAPAPSGTYYLGNTLSVTVTSSNAIPSLSYSYQWYNWVSNAWTPAAVSGPTASAYSLGTSYPPGSPNILTPGVSTYYYGVRLSGIGGVSEIFEWQFNLEKGTATAAVFDPVAGISYNFGDNKQVDVASYTAVFPVTSYQWYNWNGTSTPTTTGTGWSVAGQTTSAYYLGTGYPAGAASATNNPDVSAYYYAVELYNQSGASPKFVWYLNLNSGIAKDPVFNPGTGTPFNYGDNMQVDVTSYTASVPVTSYQWYNWNGSGWTVAAGQTASAYYLGNTYPPGVASAAPTPGLSAYYYAVEMYNQAGGSPKYEWSLLLSASVPALPTYARFNPWTNTPTTPADGGNFLSGDSIAVQLTANDGSSPVSYRWYYWNGSTYVSSSDIDTTYETGNGYGVPYAAVGVDQGAGVYRFFYTVQLSNAAGLTNAQDDVNFGWYADVQTPVLLTVNANTGGTASATQFVQPTQQSVELSATPNWNYNFDNWTWTPNTFAGGYSDTTNPTKIVMPSSAETITANFALKTVTVTTADDGNGSTSGGGVITIETTASLSAEGNAGYVLSGWAITSDSNAPAHASTLNNSLANPVTVTARGDVTVTAYFVTTTTTPAPITGATFNPVTGGTKQYYEPKSVTVTQADGAAATGYQWYYWDGSQYQTLGGQTSNTYNIGANTYPTGTPTGNQYYFGVTISNANTAGPWPAGPTPFEWNITVPDPVLTAAANTGGTATVNGTTTQSIVVGNTSGPVSATANEGYQFNNWSWGYSFAGGDTNTSNPTTVTMPASSKTITANFSLIEYTLYAIPNTGGSIAYGTPQNLTILDTSSEVSATPDAGYNFTNWTLNGAIGTNTNNPIQVTITGNTTIEANFSAISYTLSATANANGSITGGDGQTLTVGQTSAPVTAEADSGYVFTYWDLNGATGDEFSNPITITMPAANTTITANFSAV